MLKDRQSTSLMVADKRQKPRRFGKFAVGGGLRFAEHILTDVNKKRALCMLCRSGQSMQSGMSEQTENKE